MKPRGGDPSGEGTRVLPVTAVFLGGGRGCRIGGNKLYLPDGERGSLILRILDRIAPWFEAILIAVGPEDRRPLERILAEWNSSIPVRVVVDREPGRGPLEGVAAALEEVSSEWTFVLGCDMPCVREEVIRALWEARELRSDVVCAELAGFLEPLHAFYRRTCLVPIRAALEAGDLRMKGFYPRVAVTVVDEETLALLPAYGRSFWIVNTPEDLERIRGARSSSALPPLRSRRA